MQAFRNWLESPQRQPGRGGLSLALSGGWLSRREIQKGAFPRLARAPYLLPSYSHFFNLKYTIIATVIAIITSQTAM